VLNRLLLGRRYIKADFRISSAEAARLRAANLRRLLTARKLLLVLDLDHTLLNSCRFGFLLFSSSIFDVQTLNPFSALACPGRTSEWLLLRRLMRNCVVAIGALDMIAWRCFVQVC
jgi:hypothetical protein